MKILIFLFAGPENGQNYGQIGGKVGYAANKTNLRGGFVFVFALVFIPSVFAYL